jgi:hypothetical protein
MQSGLPNPEKAPAAFSCVEWMLVLEKSLRLEAWCQAGLCTVA